MNINKVNNHNLAFTEGRTSQLYVPRFNHDKQVQYACLFVCTLYSAQVHNLQYLFSNILFARKVFIFVCTVPADIKGAQV
jgi:hypothetical protein